MVHSSSSEDETEELDQPKQRNRRVANLVRKEDEGQAKETTQAVAGLYENINERKRRASIQQDELFENELDNMRRGDAALLLQSAARQRAARQAVRSRRLEVVEATARSAADGLITRLLLRELARRELARRRQLAEDLGGAAVSIQAMYRGALGRRKAKAHTDVVKEEAREQRMAETKAALDALDDGYRRGGMFRLPTPPTTPPMPHPPRLQPCPPGSGRRKGGPGVGRQIGRTAIRSGAAWEEIAEAPEQLVAAAATSMVAGRFRQGGNRLMAMLKVQAAFGGMRGLGGLAAGASAGAVPRSPTKPSKGSKADRAGISELARQRPKQPAPVGGRRRKKRAAQPRYHAHLNVPSIDGSSKVAPIFAPLTAPPLTVGAEEPAVAAQLSVPSSLGPRGTASTARRKAKTSEKPAKGQRKQSSARRPVGKLAPIKI